MITLPISTAISNYNVSRWKQPAHTFTCSSSLFCVQKNETCTIVKLTLKLQVTWHVCFLIGKKEDKLSGIKFNKLEGSFSCRSKSGLPGRLSFVSCRTPSECRINEICLQKVSPIETVSLKNVCNADYVNRILVDIPIFLSISFSHLNKVRNEFVRQIWIWWGYYDAIFSSRMAAEATPTLRRLSATVGITFVEKYFTKGEVDWFDVLEMGLIRFVVSLTRRTIWDWVSRKRLSIHISSSFCQWKNI